jgi:hypothetical protein
VSARSQNGPDAVSAAHDTKEFKHMHLARGSVKLRFATGVIAFAITAGIAGAMPAQAAQLPARPTLTQAAPADCQTPAWNDGTIWVAVATCGGEAHSMGAMTSYPIYGHFEFYGPHGFIANSPDGVYSPPRVFAAPSRSSRLRCRVRAVWQWVRAVS